MKRSALIFGLSLACCTPLWAQSSPELEFSAGGDSAWLPLTQESNGTWGVTAGTQVALGNGITFTLNSIIIDSDPYVFYSYDVTNSGSSTTQYTASIPATAASLAPGAYTVTSSLGISLTDANPNAPVWIAPTGSPNAIQQGLIGGSDAGVDLGTAQVSNSAFGSTTTTNYSGGPLVYNLTAPASDVSISETFDLSAGASVGLSGFFNVQAVPEPSSVGFALIAAGAFAGLIIRSRRLRA
jgi:hypothetical protein